MTAVLAPAATGTGAAVGAWRRLFLRCLLVPLTVTAPLTYLALGFDHRYNVYWHGAVVQARPWSLVTENLRTVPMYLDFGNFRPLGRMLEWSVDVLAYLLTGLLQLPAQVGLRLMSALAAAVLTAAAVLLAEAVTARGRMFGAPPARPLVVVPFALGASLAAAGQLSSTVLFGGLYFLSAAIVLAVAAWLARAPRSMPLVVVAGAALATVNEMAALALPVATVAVLARARLGPAALPNPASAGPAGPARPLRAVVALWAGFLPVFVPVRILIWAACRDGDCYRNSDLLLGSGLGSALPHRLVAWLPPLQWDEALREAAAPGRVVLAAAVLALAALAVRPLADLARLPSLGRRPAIALALTGAAVLLLGAGLGSVNRQGQLMASMDRWGAGWRDSGLTAAGGALLLTGLLALAARAVVLRTALVVVALGAAVSTAVNHAYAQAANRRPAALVSAAISAEIAQFDTTAAGDRRRCELRDRFAALFADDAYSRFAAGELPGTRSAADRMQVTADLATRQRYGRPFCRGAE
ncbi:hypothetical protein [Paractinoplanes rishiriensis]|uniref:Uncharacterized protein n=1 Tax=Paractinoplanes rishiriensis TaxID=1050105 RepID=A0A919MVI4_9ACTN|nr:hypothetical protein [Actinoplanes rishiriensis]GIE93650.1 hypothetical protein Ari01nite_11150 [Actinoplanes rishiriensis]